MPESSLILTCQHVARRTIKRRATADEGTAAA